MTTLNVFRNITSLVGIVFHVNRYHLLSKLFQTCSELTNSCILSTVSRKRNMLMS